MVTNKSGNGPANRAGSNVKAFTADKKKQMKLLEDKDQKINKLDRQLKDAEEDNDRLTKQT